MKNCLSGLKKIIYFLTYTVLTLSQLTKKAQIITMNTINKNKD